jgi:hypothetical protein
MYPRRRWGALLATLVIMLAVGMIACVAFVFLTAWFIGGWEYALSVVFEAERMEKTVMYSGAMGVAVGMSLGAGLCRLFFANALNEANDV